MSMLLTENVGYVLKRCSVARYCALLMRVAHMHCSCALPMHEFIVDFVCIPSCSQYPEADGSDESTCGLGPRPQKNRNNRSCNPNKHMSSVRFQTLKLLDCTGSGRRIVRPELPCMCRLKHLNGPTICTVNKNAQKNMRSSGRQVPATLE